MGFNRPLERRLGFPGGLGPHLGRADGAAAGQSQRPIHPVAPSQEGVWPVRQRRERQTGGDSFPGKVRGESVSLLVVVSRNRETEAEQRYVCIPCFHSRLFTRFACVCVCVCVCVSV